MSRSRYKVAKQPFAYGSNTEFYRELHRSVRRRNKQVLGVCLRSESGDAPPEVFRYFRRIPWQEPTDDSFIVFPNRDYRWLREGTYERLLRK